MVDWRAQRDAALVELEAAQRPAKARVAAAALLVELAAEDDRRWPELMPALPRLLSDKLPGVRRKGLALAALILAPAEAEGLLAARLADEAAEVRMEAAGQLADLATPTVRAALAPALADPALAVRFEAARGMAAVRHSAGLDVLVEALDDDELRFRALGALAELGDTRALPAVQRLFRRWLLPYFDRTQAAGALARLGDPRGGEYLLQRTKRRWSVDRPLAVELCGEVKVAGALERLTAILQDRKDPCRGAAARGLGRLGDARALPALVAVLEDEGAPEGVRLDAAEGLIRLGGPEARGHVERALATVGSREAREELEGMLEEHP